MQLARLAVLAHAAPVPDAVGHVAGLLNFIGLHARAQRVHHAVRHVIHVARGDLYPIERLFHVAVFHIGERGAALQAIGDFRAGIATEHDPGFGLAALAVPLLGVRVAGMYLHGQRLARVEQFEQEREFLRAGQGFAPLFLRLIERERREAAVHDQARHAGKRAGFQGFAGGIVWRRLAEIGLELVAAPGRFAAVAEIGLCQQGIIHCCASLCFVR